MNDIMFSRVIVARNDEYLGNFKHRLEMTINYFASNVDAAGIIDNFEVLLVDWNSEAPLREALNLNEAARKITFFVEVTPEIVKRNGLRADRIEMTTALNVGIRKASGNVLIMTAADVLFPYQTLVSLCDLFRKKVPFPVDVHNCYLGIDRFEIPWQASEWLCEGDIDRYCAMHAQGMHLDPRGRRNHGVSSNEGALVITRSLLLEVSGFDEKNMHGIGSETDLVLRLNQTIPLVKASLIGAFCYDLFPNPRLHNPNRETSPSAPPKFAVDSVVNDENWGLAREVINRKAALHCPNVDNNPAKEASPYLCDFGGSPTLRNMLSHIEKYTSHVLFESFFRRYVQSAILKIASLKKRNIFLRKLSTIARHCFVQSLVFEWLASSGKNRDFFCAEWFGDVELLRSFLHEVLDARLYSYDTRMTLESAATLVVVVSVIGKTMPRRFLCCPGRDVYLMQAAAASVSSLELVCYDHWQGANLFDLVHALGSTDFKGYLHIHTGRMDSAFERLAAMPLAGEPFQCIFLDLNFFNSILSSLVSRIEPLLDSACTLICRGTRGDLLQMKEGLHSQGFYEVALMPGVSVYTRDTWDIKK